MSSYQLLTMGLYGLLAVLALWATWHDRDLRWLGSTLALSYSVSNLTWLFATTAFRPGIYTLLELFIIVSAYMCWLARGGFTLIVLVAVSVLSIAANVAFASLSAPTFGHIQAYEIITNICFAAECLLATGIGLADGYRVGRFARRSFARRTRPQPDAARKET